MEEMTIKELSSVLQKKINDIIESFTAYHQEVLNKTNEIEQLEQYMFELIEELEPVESLIYNQNPQLRRIFESLKRVYGRDENGIDREIN